MTHLICPHCGTANRAGSNFCNRCGTNLRSEEDVRPLDAPPLSPADTPASETAGQPEARGGETPTPEMKPGERPGMDDQPWLRPDFVGEDDVPLAAEEDAGMAGVDVDAGVSDTTEIPTAPGRLVSGVQGLLEPIRVATIPGEVDRMPVTAEPATLPSGLDAEQLRRIRTLMAEESLLVPALSRAVRPVASLWLPWIFAVIGVAAAVPVFLQLLRPAGEPRTWPGVASAFAAVDRLPPQATVQIFWAYDPATAGEMNLLAAPVVRQLLDRGALLAIVSQLPNGPATARRLFAQVQSDRSNLDVFRGQAAAINARFLPGGITVLPILGRTSADLAVVFAAQAEDVQHWLEQVAPLNHAPVVAITAAGADPILRPYLDSGQLVGLVSGFDGAYSYTRLYDRLPTRQEEQRLRVQIVGENIAQLALLAIIVIGNLVALLGWRRQDG